MTKSRGGLHTAKTPLYSKNGVMEKYKQKETFMFHTMCTRISTTSTGILCISTCTPKMSVCEE